MPKLKRSDRTRKVAAPSRKDVLDRCSKTEDVDELISLTKHDDAVVRKTALREMCPCHVLDDIPAFWKRVLEMVDDDDDDVREQVLHTLADGSPAAMEDAVIEAIKTFAGDSNKTIRRRANKVLGCYDATGRWNIL